MEEMDDLLRKVPRNRVGEGRNQIMGGGRDAIMIEHKAGDGKGCGMTDAVTGKRAVI